MKKRFVSYLILGMLIVSMIPIQSVFAELDDVQHTIYVDGYSPVLGQFDKVGDSPYLDSNDGDISYISSDGSPHADYYYDIEDINQSVFSRIINATFLFILNLFYQQPSI